MYDDELDFEEEESSEDDLLADPEDDRGEENAVITVAPLDAAPIAKAMENLPSSSPIARSLIIDLQTMHQLLGDADAYLADKLRDIESGVRLLFSEFYKQPAVTLMGVLSRLDSSEQLNQIEIITKLLQARKDRIQGQLGGPADE